jgi:hypothetical protein
MIRHGDICTQQKRAARLGANGQEAPTRFMSKQETIESAENSGSWEEE